MAKIYQFPSSNQIVSSDEEISLDEWVFEHSNADEMRSIFLNMDRALKYIHDHGYCIEVFYPSEIEVLNNEDDYIQFNQLMELPSDFVDRKKYIQEDIFNSSLVQIGMYSNSLKYLTPTFLKENFDSFTQFLPEGDVPYYRGVVQRGASVYFCEYSLEKRNRDLENLAKEVGETSSDKSGGSITPLKEDITNERINSIIYKQLSGKKDAAFIYALVIPSVLLMLLFLCGLFSWIISLIFT